MEGCSDIEIVLILQKKEERGGGRSKSNVSARVIQRERQGWLLNRIAGKNVMNTRCIAN